jgi:hypothetical protein
MNDEEKVFEFIFYLERDSSAKSPTSRDFSAKDIERQHLALALNLGQYYKTFFDRNLRIFVISQSVCYGQASPA